ncbi:hypothetical protein ABFS83_11G028800 [Erythranthe nasuta]
MEKINVQMITLLLLLLLFCGGGVAGNTKKECEFRTTSKCWPKEKCEPNACAAECIQDTNTDDSECAYHKGFYICFCLSGCRTTNSTTTTTAASPMTPPASRPLRRRRRASYRYRCM